MLKKSRSALSCFKLFVCCCCLVAFGVYLVASGTVPSAPLATMWAGGGLPTRWLVYAKHNTLL